MNSKFSTWYRATNNRELNVILLVSSVENSVFLPACYPPLFGCIIQIPTKKLITKHLFNYLNAFHLVNFSIITVESISKPSRRAVPKTTVLMYLFWREHMYKKYKFNANFLRPLRHKEFVTWKQNSKARVTELYCCKQMRLLFLYLTWYLSSVLIINLLSSWRRS